MNAQHITVALLLVAGFVNPAWAQGTEDGESRLKIGYANIEAVLVNMPETKAMTQTLETFRKQIGEKLRTKQEFGRIKLEEYQAFVQQTPPPEEAALRVRQDELMKLDQDIQRDTMAAEEQLLEKRESLLEPITAKLQAELEAIAESENYDLILNTVDGGGASIILYGPPEHDLTRKLFARLGIPLPDGAGSGE